MQRDAHAVEGRGHSGRRIPVGDHRGEPIQRRDQGRRRPGERSRRGEQNHLVGDLGQPALHPCLGRRAGIGSTDVDRGGVEEERARPQPGDRVQGGRAHECLPVAGELAAEGDEARAGRRGGALGEQLHHPHGVGDDRPREVVRQRPGELVGRGTGVQGDGVARAHQLDGPAGDAPGTCRAPGDRIGVADGEPDASVHGADLTRRLEPLQVAAHRHGRDAEIAGEVGDGEDADLTQEGEHPGTALRPGGEPGPAPGIASVTGPPPARSGAAPHDQLHRQLHRPVPGRRPSQEVQQQADRDLPRLRHGQVDRRQARADHRGERGVVEPDDARRAGTGTPRSASRPITPAATSSL